MSEYDVQAVRDRYPALADGWAYLDGAAGTQVPRAVIDAESAAYAGGIGNHGGFFAASLRAAGFTRAARQGVADLVGAPSPDEVALGPSTTALTYRFADGLAKTWRPGDEIVLTRLDHDANVRPWVQAAARAGVRVRWADPVLPTLDLPVEAVTAELSERTRLVAVTAASNVVGTRPDVRAIADAAHAAGALVYVDGVHATPHTPVDLVALGADLYATSAYKWSGPHLAAVVAVDPGVLEAIHPDKLDSATDDVPERFEYGTSPFAQHAGLAAAVDHLAGLADLAGVGRAGERVGPAGTGEPRGAGERVGLTGAGAAGAGGPSGAGAAGIGERVPGGTVSRRERLLASMAAVEAYETALMRRLLDGLAGLDRVRRIGSPVRHAPTVWFTVDGLHPDRVAEHCATARVNVWSGHNYAYELAGFLGIRESGSAVRAGLSCYSTPEDVDRLLTALADLPGGTWRRV